MSWMQVKPFTRQLTPPLCTPPKQKYKRFRYCQRLSVRASAQPAQGEADTRKIAELQLKQLKQAMKNAILKEDYEAAARYRDEIQSIEASDPVLQAEAQLEEAIREERYEEAARLRDRLAELKPPPPVFDCPPVTSDTVTNGVRVQVKSFFVPSQSYPPGNQFLFAYSIRITNEGSGTVQLLRRYWLITDGSFKSQEVRGPGVVGEQPVLGPGEKFEYQSACPLRTPVGSMEGHFEFVTRTSGGGGEAAEGGGEEEWGEPFNAAIGKFGLNVEGDRY